MTAAHIARGLGPARNRRGQSHWTTSASPGRVSINFDAVNRTARSQLLGLLSRWLPQGRREGGEWVALNPRRADRRLGSFKINIRTGKWADFATGDSGGDPISLVAYIENIPQGSAARRLASWLGIGADHQ